MLKQTFFLQTLNNTMEGMMKWYTALIAEENSEMELSSARNVIADLLSLKSWLHYAQFAK
jgi:hypothetical protein